MTHAHARLALIAAVVVAGSDGAPPSTDAGGVCDRDTDGGVFCNGARRRAWMRIRECR